MDLFDLMTKGQDPEDLALDRLEGIVALYESDEDSVQDEALARAIGLCGKQWGGYKAGLEALAKRVEDRAGDTAEASLEALKLWEEADDAGAMIRMARQRRSESGKESAARAAIIARYGSLDQALTPTPVERLFVEAAEPLADPDENGSIDPWSPLAGWSLPWHEIPAALREAVENACPLPATITDARDEALTWEARKAEMELLVEGPGEAALFTACAARHRIVEDLWRRDLPARCVEELEARLEYWSSRGGDDGLGYGVVLQDLRSLAASGALAGRVVESTKDKARRLKAENPSWSLARIGQELGISRQAVHKHLKG
jgi:hypothetical protein